ncbi:MAG TPA: nucleotidyltransferase family protein [Gemmatimonadaceae bacterium]
MTATLAEPSARAIRRSPTERLLCACARRADDANAARLFADVPWDSVDWASVPALLVRHGLQALAVAHLSIVRDRMPGSVWQEIHASAAAARAASLALSAELFRILRRFGEAGLEILPYKGPLLGWEAYGDLGARPSMDLDLLVRPADFDAAAALLDDLGYRADDELPPAAARWFRRVDGDYPFEHRETGRLVELHVRTMSLRFGAGPTTAELLARSRVVTISGLRTVIPGTDDLFYLQVVHGAKHRWERLEWVAATAELLRARRGDVAALFCRRYPNERAVLLGCRLAADLLDAPVDAGTAARMAGDGVVRELADAARHRLFHDARPDDDAPGETAAKLRFNFRLQRGVAARARFLYRWIVWPSPEDWEQLRLPAPLFFAYRLTRPVRLLRRYALRSPSLEPDARHG